jgi:hypothetical protein
MQIGPMVTKWRSTITKKTQDEKVVIYHKLTNDGGALAMMCGRDEKPQSNVATRWRIVMACTHCKAMDTRYW